MGVNKGKLILKSENVVIVGISFIYLSFLIPEEKFIAFFDGKLQSRGSIIFFLQLVQLWQY